MDVNFKKYLTFGLFVFLISSILFASNAFADADASGASTTGGAVFSNLTETGWTIFSGMREVIFAAAGFGILAVAIGGLFGAFNWRWLGAIIIGVVVISLTVGLIQYLASGSGTDFTKPGEVSDTLITGS